MNAQDCLICALEDAPDSARVFADQLWAAEVAPGYEVPGWYFLRVRRHTELVTGLNDAELETLGHRAADLTAAIRAATGAEAVYFMSFGESYRHYHALIATRGGDVPPARRGGHIVGLLPDAVDRPAAMRIAAKVRAAYREGTKTNRNDRAGRTDAVELLVERAVIHPAPNDPMGSASPGGSTT